MVGPDEGIRWRRFAELPSRHGAFALVVVAAVALRALVWLSLFPANWFSGDSFSYVVDAVRGGPDLWRPSGYSLLLLRPLLPAHSLALVTAVQHALGLCVGTVVYALLLRHGLPRWVAALAAVPVLFDAYVVSVEQMLLSEALFTALLVTAVALLLWRPSRPGTVACCLAGLLLGVSAITRTVGLPVVAVAALTALVRRAGPGRVGALLVAAVLPLAGYATWFHHSFGRWGTTASGGLFLYGRVSQFVNCGRMSSATLRSLCPSEPRGDRRNIGFYVFGARSPINRASGDMVERNALAGRFARQAVLNQPGDYAAQSWRMLAGQFSARNGRSAGTYRFDRVTYVPPAAKATTRRYERGDPNTKPDPRGVRALLAYQRLAWVPGVAFLAALLLAALGVAFGRDTGQRGLRSALLLVCGASLVLFVLPALTVGADVRYRLPALPLLAVAGPLGLALLAQRAAARWPVLAHLGGLVGRRGRDGQPAAGATTPAEATDMETTRPDLT